MTKYDFLKNLEHFLGNLNADMKADIIADFREHFDIATESGKSEEEICTILGDPLEIAKEFMQDYTRFTKAKQDANLENVNKNQNDHVQISGNVVFANFSGSTKTISIEAITCDIEILGKSTEHVLVEFSDNNDERFNIISMKEEGKLFIQEKPYKQNYSNFFGRNSFFGNMSRDNIKMIITLPLYYSGEIELQTASGDVNISSLLNLGSCRLKTASGDITVNNVASSGLFRLQTGSGDIDVTSLKSDDIIKLSTGSGDITLDDCHAPSGFELQTGSGDIESQGSSGDIKANTGSGDIDIAEHSGTVVGTTGSGDIEINTDELATECKYATGSGDIEISCRRLSKDLYMTSGTGDISLRVNDLCANVTAKTANGDIDALVGEESDVRFVLITGRHGEKHNGFTWSDPQRGINREDAKYKMLLETHMGDVSVKPI